jgi:nicotinamide riboside kinase
MTQVPHRVTDVPNYRCCAPPQQPSPLKVQDGRRHRRCSYKFRLVRRVIVVGPGAAGKSTLAVRLGDITGLPVIELDKRFWQPGLAATPRDQWAAIQHELASQESWILDGDLGPYDVLDVRLEAADTVVFLDFSPLRCAWRAVRRSRERADFWVWLLSYRLRSRPPLLRAIAAHAGDADIHVLRNPRQVRQFLASVAPGMRK